MTQTPEQIAAGLSSRVKANLIPDQPGEMPSDVVMWCIANRVTQPCAADPAKPFGIDNMGLKWSQKGLAVRAAIQAQEQTNAD